MPMIFLPRKKIKNNLRLTKIFFIFPPQQTTTFTHQTNMTKLSKTHEGCTVWVKPNSFSPVQKRKILKVWEDADSYEFKYGNWDESIADKDGFSKSTYRDVLSHWQVTEVLARYDKPLNFWREIKIAAIRVVHLVLERLEFNMKN